jgi:hypothetical protein
LTITLDPESLVLAREIEWPAHTGQQLFGFPGTTASLEDGWTVLASSVQAPPADLIPIAMVDDRSIACVVGGDAGEPLYGHVVRWLLDDAPSRHQAALLDVDALLYLDSLSQELAARDAGFRLMVDRIFPDYERDYVAEGRSPRSHVTRPVRLACQNVVAGLGAFAHDSTFDGLSVPAWQTCELPHVATHDGNRAMTALLLCEAFQAGGTMEIRFDRNNAYGPHPEASVPASLRRYARTLGLWLGETEDDRARLTPQQSRELFLAVTPMHADLRRRVRLASQTGAVMPERLCFMLMAQVWSPVEMDFMLGVSPRAVSILHGGASLDDRGARQAETHVARAALMIGMLHGRLDSKDVAGNEGVRVLEDNRQGIRWEIAVEAGGVWFGGLRERVLPWSQGAAHLAADRRPTLLAIPRSHASREVIEQAKAMSTECTAAVVLPADADPTPLAEEGVTVLRCPDRIGELDRAIETRLARALTVRA